MRKSLFLVVLLIAGSLFAADPKLVVANVPGVYTTSLQLTAAPDLDHLVTIDVSRCVVGPSGASLKVPPGGANYVRNLGSSACIDQPFFLLTIPPPTVTAETTIFFHNGADRSSFTVPPIGAVAGDDQLAVVVDREGKPAGLISDDVEGTWFTFFPTKPDTPIIVAYYDATSPEPKVIGVDRWTAQPPVAQFRSTFHGIARAELRLGMGIPAPYGCWPEASCSVYGEVYGFATSGTADGGVMRVYPLPVAP